MGKMAADVQGITLYAAPAVTPHNMNQRGRLRGVGRLAVLVSGIRGRKFKNLLSEASGGRPRCFSVGGRKHHLDIHTRKIEERTYKFVHQFSMECHHAGLYAGGAGNHVVDAAFKDHIIEEIHDDV